MRKYLILFLLIFLNMGLGAWAALEPSESDEFTGQDAPLVSFQTLVGDSLSLEGFKGHPILLNFFASWCPPCRQEIAELMKLHKKYSPDGLVIIGAATDSKMMPETSREKERNDVMRISERLRIPYPITIADQGFVQAYHFKGIPTTVFINRDGKIAKVFYGFHKVSLIEEIVNKMLSAKGTS